MRRVLECLAVEQSSDKKVTLFPERELVVEIDVSILGQETTIRASEIS
jgi:hypothetical protein